MNQMSGHAALLDQFATTIDSSTTRPSSADKLNCYNNYKGHQFPESLAQQCCHQPIDLSYEWNYNCQQTKTREEQQTEEELVKNAFIFCFVQLT